jgi:FtsJ-like methyltransferase
VTVERLTASAGPTLLLAFVSPVYADAALNELVVLVGARQLAWPAPNVLLAAVPDKQLVPATERLRAEPPVFVRQVLFPAVRVDRTGSDQADALALLAQVPSLQAEGAVLCDAEGRLPRELAGLKAALGPAVGSERVGWVVLATPEHLYTGPVLAAGHSSSPWPGGRPLLAYEPDFVSRSALKLLEALAIFGVPVREGSRVLDLGAAPGGWSQVLAGRGALVTAVDPGVLDPRVASLSRVTAYRGTAHMFLRQATELYDLIVDDMRLDARESARLLVQARSLLAPGGEIIATLKLPARAPGSVLRPALGLVQEAYAILGQRCLYFNRHEVTVHARCR